MERLTEKKFNQNVIPLRQDGHAKWTLSSAGPDNLSEMSLYGVHADKLAGYEDLEEQCIEENQCGIRELLAKWKTFFDDITELYKYRKAEEQGLLLQFKCKVGDTVYHLMGDNQIDSYKVMAIEVGEDGVKYFIENSRSAMWRSEKWFDKAVFLAYETAKAALAEHKKGGAE